MALKMISWVWDPILMTMFLGFGDNCKAKQDTPFGYSTSEDLDENSCEYLIMKYQ